MRQHEVWPSPAGIGIMVRHVTSALRAVLCVAIALLLVSTVATGAEQEFDDAPRHGGSSARELAGIREGFIAANGDLPITAIHIDGLKRTHPVVIEQFIHAKPGDRLSTVDIITLYERLYKLAILSSVAITLGTTDGGVAITITIAEKWTLYPVPIIWLFQGTEVGADTRNEDPVTVYGGPGLGLRFYLRNVSVPAVGLDVGYEVNSGRVSFSVVVGYRPTR